MLKLTVAVLAVVLAGTANAAGWRSLRFDASSEEAFTRSLETFRDKLSPVREYVLGRALQDIWTEGSKAATAAQREYADAEYYASVHGLSYEEIVTLKDPTGEKEGQYRAEYYQLHPRPRPPAASVPRTNDVYPRPDGPGHRG